jgi:FAD:protein FMN transferase
MKSAESISFRALGTDVFLEVIPGSFSGQKKARKDLERAKEIFFEKENIFSRFNSGSELCQLNKKISVWQKASQDIRYLSKRALYYNEISGALYDPRIIEILERIGYDKGFKKKKFSEVDTPPVFSAVRTGLGEDLKIENGKIFFRRRMDFSGIAKGYIVDQAADFLKSRGWKNFLVDAGGDMRISGLNSEGEKWRIAVEGISEKKFVLEVTNRGIATSGISRKKWEIQGRKFHHLVNPKDPNKFSYQLRTVSVVARNTEEADGRAKTLVLMGKETGLKFAKENKIAAIFLDYKGGVFISPEAKKYVNL